MGISQVSVSNKHLETERLNNMSKTKELESKIAELHNSYAMVTASSSTNEKINALNLSIVKLKADYEQQIVMLNEQIKKYVNDNQKLQRQVDRSEENIKNYKAEMIKMK